jgi:lysophospholipase L1-like esterase
VTETDRSSLDYVALGDSYTIGTSVSEDERWPNQLVARMATNRSRGLRLIANLGVNGFRSEDVIRVELPRLPSLAPEFASLLVGVNDVVRRVAPDRYRANVIVILDSLLESLGPNRIVAVSTPDYTVTPQGADYGDPATQSGGIRRNNAILGELASDRSIAFVDIFDISVRAATDRSLVASDGLHPSGGQYALWVDRMTPVVEDLLAR